MSEALLAFEHAEDRSCSFLACFRNKDFGSNSSTSKGKLCFDGNLHFLRNSWLLFLLQHTRVSVWRLRLTITSLPMKFGHIILLMRAIIICKAFVIWLF